MLAIGIHENQDFTRGRARAGLDGGAISHAIWMIDNLNTMSGAYGWRIIGGPVVDHDNLSTRKTILEGSQQSADILCLIFGWNNYRERCHDFIGMITVG